MFSTRKKVEPDFSSSTVVVDIIIYYCCLHRLAIMRIRLKGPQKYNSYVSPPFHYSPCFLREKEKEKKVYISPPTIS